VGLQVVLASPAQADFGSIACEVTWDGARLCVMKGNNADHSVRWEGVIGNQIPNIGANTTWAMNNVYNPTDLNMYRNDSDPYPDVIITDSLYPDIGLVAWAECLPYAPNGEYEVGKYNTGVGGNHPDRWCRGQKIRYNERYESTDYSTTADARKVTCHELGHTIGLRHTASSASCMYQAAAAANGPAITQGERNEINGEY
jgi:hypothetical protein